MSQMGKREKAEARIRLHEELPPDPWERFRIVSDCIREARQTVDLYDHRARYALVIVGVLNAGVLAVAGSSRRFGEVPATMRPWLIAAVVIYAVLTLAFVLSAIESLRPRPPEVLRQVLPAPTGEEASGLLMWEAVGQYALEEYHAAWDRVRMVQINREEEAIFHALAGVVLAKHRALRRLYMGLVALVVMAALLLIGATWLVVRGS